MKHLYIFDYASCEIAHKIIENDNNGMYDEIVENLGYRLADCYYMVSNEVINIKEL